MGAYLRAARTEQRISLERAAQDTKIKADFLMRMESDEFDFIAPAYARGFLRSYARFLGLDDGPFLEEFDRRYGTKPVDTVQMVAADRGKTKKVRDHTPFSRWTILLVLIAGVLLALGLIGYFAPQPARERGARVADRTESPSPTPSKERKKASPTPTPSPTPTTTDVFFSDGIELTVEAVEGDCWVDIDADGADLFAETLTAGETETFEAEDEMIVVLGAPGNIELTLNGEDFGEIDTVESGALNFTLPEDFGTEALPIPEGFDPEAPDEVEISPSPTIDVDTDEETT